MKDYTEILITDSNAYWLIFREASRSWTKEKPWKESWAEQRRRKMACVTLKRSLDFDPLHSPSRPIKRRRWAFLTVFVTFINCISHLRCVPMGQPHGCSPSKRDTGECSSPSKPSGELQLIPCPSKDVFLTTLVALHFTPVSVWVGRWLIVSD